MNLSRIQELSEFIPKNSKYFNLLDFSRDEDEDLNRFAHCYKDLSFCWHLVKSLEGAPPRPLPRPITESYIIRAYNYLYIKPRSRDPHLEQAIAYASILPSNYKNAINSMLFVSGITIKKIADAFGVDEEVIWLYEKLFYNILDRKEEHLFVTTLVYPETKLEELDPRYMDKVEAGVALKRAAFNNGEEDALAMIGFNTSYLADSSAEDNSSRLENAIMANAYFLSKNGFGNSRNAIGISNAKNLIAAAKHGGNEDSTTEVVGAGALGTILLTEVRKHEEPLVQKRLQHERELNELALKEAQEATEI